MKNFLIGFLIFVCAFILGNVFRVAWLFFVQRPMFQYTYLDADIRAVKTGGKTPQETWGLYMSALEKGDINEALQFVHPDSRESKKTFLQDEQKKDNLKEFLVSHHKEIRQLENTSYVKKDEKRFTYLTSQEEKNFLGEFQINPGFRTLANEPEESLKEFMPDVIFFYNRYARLWLIK